MVSNKAKEIRTKLAAGVVGVSAALAASVSTFVSSVHATTTLAPAEIATGFDAHVTDWITAFQPLILKYVGYALALAGLAFLIGLFYSMIRNRR
jgi:hypothetical protein